jgi:hypothetical protein
MGLGKKLPPLPTRAPLPLLVVNWIPLTQLDAGKKSEEKKVNRKVINVHALSALQHAGD